MKSFDSGVGYYTEAKTAITVFFPENQVLCKWCPFCRAEETLGRFWCRLTNNMIYNPYIGVAESCPLEIVKKEE